MGVDGDMDESIGREKIERGELGERRRRRGC